MGVAHRLRGSCDWPAHVRIAVNVSPIQFRSETLSLKPLPQPPKPGSTRAGWSSRSRKPS